MRRATRAGIPIDLASSAWLIALTGRVFDGLHDYCRPSPILGRDTPT